jgi:hypothetical protein
MLTIETLESRTLLSVGGKPPSTLGLAAMGVVETIWRGQAAYAFKGQYIVQFDQAGVAAKPAGGGRRPPDSPAAPRRRRQPRSSCSTGRWALASRRVVRRR